MSHFDLSILAVSLRSLHKIWKREKMRRFTGYVIRNQFNLLMACGPVCRSYRSRETLKYNTHFLFIGRTQYTLYIQVLSSHIFKVINNGKIDLAC